MPAGATIRLSVARRAHRQISKAFAEQGRDSDALKAVGRALELYPANQEYKRWQDKLAAA
ncbi:MAG: hypothetical protein O3A08_00565 [Proteobacteria bacterium]|nr:hypothetical protein [Pseudomonadota bacterium]